LNYGYVYQAAVGSKVYVGASTYFVPFVPFVYGANLLGLPFIYSDATERLMQINTKIQYGRIFSSKQNLLKISLDYFLSPISNDVAGHTSYSTIGIFVEKEFSKNRPLNGYSFGISLNWSIWDIFIIKDRNRKYFRKYEN
jgi:hypothetical protein